VDDRTGGCPVFALSARLSRSGGNVLGARLEVDQSTINRWVLACAPMIEKQLRQFRRPHCGSVRVDETYVKICGSCDH
jgi:Zn finger protein HypA/HybF involved in hydrogenase expression